MDKVLHRLSQDAAEKMAALILTPAYKSVIEKTKAASDSDTGTFKVVISTADVDRMGETVDQNGWDLAHYKNNPVVLWAHDYKSLPIGVCTSIEVQDGQLVAQGKFAPEEANPFAQQVRRLYDGKFISATSVGFIPEEMDGEKQGKINKSQLLEFSFVPVPANPFCLRLNMVKKLNLDLNLMTTKGLAFSIDAKAAEVGSACQMDDGTPGTMAQDPNDSDELVCVPIKDAGEKGAGSGTSEPNSQSAEDALLGDLGIEHSKHLGMMMKHLDVLGEAMNHKKMFIKGAVDDQMQEDAVRKAKYTKLDKAWNVFYAFTSAYMEDETPVEDFEKLLDEAVSLMKEVGEAESKSMKKYIGKKTIAEQHEKAVDEFRKSMKDEHGRHEDKSIEIAKSAIAEFKEAVDDNSGESKTAKEAKEKSGRTISKKNSEMLKEIHEHADTICTAVKEMLETAKPEGDEGEGNAKPSPEEKNASKKVEKQTAAGAPQDLTSFLEGRELLRDVSTLIDDSLGRFNKRIRDISKKG